MSSIRFSKNTKLITLTFCELHGLTEAHSLELSVDSVLHNLPAHSTNNNYM